MSVSLVYHRRLHSLSVATRTVKTVDVALFHHFALQTAAFRGSRVTILLLFTWLVTREIDCLVVSLFTNILYSREAISLRTFSSKVKWICISGFRHFIIIAWISFGLHFPYCSPMYIYLSYNFLMNYSSYSWYFESMSQILFQACPVHNLYKIQWLTLESVSGTYSFLFLLEQSSCSTDCRLCWIGPSMGLHSIIRFFSMYS